MKQALIVFTDLPVVGGSMTGLRPYYTKEQCAGLHEAFLKDIYQVVSDSLADIFVFHSEGDEDEVESLKDIYRNATFLVQRGVTFEGRLYDAMSRVFNLGYSRVLLMESLMPDFTGEDINRAFDILTRKDYVFGPLDDGSYWCIGAKFDSDTKSMMPIFSIDFTSDTILEDTLEIIPSWKKYGLLEEKSVVSNIEELLIFRESGIGGYTGEYLEKNHIVSAIIPVYNNSACLTRTFAQVDKFCGRAEVIFVDGGSDDGSAELVKGYVRTHMNSKVIRSGKGRGTQINAGVEAANGDVLFFLEPDCELCDRPLEEILKVMDYCSAGYFEVDYRNGGLAMWYNKRCVNKGASRGMIIGEQGLFVKRDVFHDNGMFKENTDMEDIDFSAGLGTSGITPKPAAAKIYPSMNRYEGGFFQKIKQIRQEQALRQMYLIDNEPKLLSE